jgi:hypothetical protein
MAQEVVTRLTEKGLDTSIVMTADANTSAFAPIRGFCTHILRHLSNRHTHKVLAGLRLMQYLAPGISCTIEAQVNPTVRAGTRLSKLRFLGVLYDAVPPSGPPSADASALLRASELERLKLLLDLCRAANELEVPITNSRDRRKVRGLALALGTTEEVLLSEWGRATLYAPRPQATFAQGLFRATFEWCVSLVNDAWSQQLSAEPVASTSLTITHLPPLHDRSDSGFDAFGAFITQEAVSQQIADMLPLVDIGDLPPSMRPSVEEIPCLRDTVFAHAASGLFGEAGLLHFLSSGCRSASAIASYVEMVRDGDLAMRRYFGPRLRETLRVRSGELLVSFDTAALAAATSFEPFCGFEVGAADGPVWSVKDTNSRGRSVPMSKILRTVACIDQCTKAMRGDVIVSHLRPEDQVAGMVVPAPVRLSNLWKDQVSLRELTAHIQRLGLGYDPLKVLNEVYGDRPRPYVVVGDDLHFASGQLTQLYRDLQVRRGGDSENQDPTEKDLLVPAAPRVEELPRSWCQPRRQKMGLQDAFMASIQRPPPVTHARRDTTDQVISMEEQLTLDVPKDSRRKAKLRRDDESARLMYTTCQLISMDQIVSKAQEDAENAADATGRAVGPEAEFAQPALTDVEEREREVLEVVAGWRPHAEEKKGNPILNPVVVQRLNRVRAIFRGNHERKLMARLMMEHVAAEKIQLAWLETRRRMHAAASVIQNAYRSQLFRDILRGMSQAKDLLRAEEGDGRLGGEPIGTTRGGVRVPSTRMTALQLPWSGGKYEDKEIAKLMRKAVTYYLGLPMDLDQKLVRVESVEAHPNAATVKITLDLPLRVRPQIEDLQDVVDRDRERGTRNSPLSLVIDALGGWSVGPRKEVREPPPDRADAPKKKVVAAKGNSKASKLSAE